MEENKIEETGNEQHVLEKLMALFPEIPQEGTFCGNRGIDWDIS